MAGGRAMGREPQPRRTEVVLIDRALGCQHVGGVEILAHRQLALLSLRARGLRQTALNFDFAGFLHRDAPSRFGLL